MRLSALEPALALIGAIGMIASTACTTATPTETPGLYLVGKTVLHYKGPEVETVLSYRVATLRPGEDWLFLDVAITGTGRDSVELKREKISVRIPSGDVVPLATQREFGEVYPQLTAALARADVAAEPLDYFVNRKPKSLNFLVAPGTGISFDSVWVNDLDVAVGRLCFFVPGGVQNGPYELLIDLQESKVRIPFRLGET
ncbi:MAG TPA: hypothetical protein VMT19_05870 [Thermoanaerobaculaceae bacterium]|nr:hypothetical protein [Thermoanaerobaculaceae bacterium]